MRKKILVLVSNPKGTPPVELLSEIRKLQNALQNSQYRENFVLEWRVAEHQSDLRRYILYVKPQILHFCGHGTQQGLVLEDDNGTAQVVPNEVLTALLRLFSDRIECVVLNACHSSPLADDLVQHLNYVIGMKQAIFDDHAIAFAEGFYDALGAGEPYPKAFEIGRSAVFGKSISRASDNREIVCVEDGEPISHQTQEHLIPVLKINPNPKTIRRYLKFPWKLTATVVSCLIITVSAIHLIPFWSEKVKTAKEKDCFENVREKNKMGIAIARFNTRLKTANRDITTALENRIFNRLEETKFLDAAVCPPLRHTASNIAEAKVLAKEQGALIIIWGERNDLGIILNVTTPDEKAQGLNVFKAINSLVIPFGQQSSDSLLSDLPKVAQVMTAYNLSLLYRSQARDDESLKILEDALVSVGSNLETGNLDMLKILSRAYAALSGLYDPDDDYECLKYRNKCEKALSAMETALKLDKAWGLPQDEVVILRERLAMSNTN